VIKITLQALKRVECLGKRKVSFFFFVDITNRERWIVLRSGEESQKRDDEILIREMERLIEREQ
jgi:hypothetical protein